MQAGSITDLLVLAHFFLLLLTILPGGGFVGAVEYYSIPSLPKHFSFAHLCVCHSSTHGCHRRVVQLSWNCHLLLVLALSTSQA